MNQLTTDELTTLLETVEGRQVNEHYVVGEDYVGSYMILSPVERDALCAAVRQLRAERRALGLVYCPECVALREQLASAESRVARLTSQLDGIMNCLAKSQQDLEAARGVDAPTETGETRAPKA